MLNRCEFIGNLGADVEARYTQAGDAVSNFRIGVTEKWKDGQGNPQENTEWIPCVAWKRLGEVCAEFLSKGSKVYVAGKWQTKKWKDQNGNDRYSTELVVKEMVMLSPRNQEYAPPVSHGANDVPPTGDNVPF